MEIIVFGGEARKTLIFDSAIVCMFNFILDGL